MGHFPHAIGNNSFLVSDVVVVTTVYLNTFILFFGKSQSKQFNVCQSLKHSFGFPCALPPHTHLPPAALYYGIVMQQIV